MSWIISNALMKDYVNSHCSQVLAEDCLEAIYLDGAQSAELNGIHTQLVYLSPDKMTAFSRLSRFGMMCKPLTEDLGEDLLMWYLEDSHAKTLAAREKAQASQENDQECGRTWRGSLAKYDPNTHSLKTAQCSLLEDSTQSSVTLPRWGTMRNGELYQQPIVAHLTCGRGYGSLLPTPVASDATTGDIIGKDDTFYTTKTGMPRKVNRNGKDGSVGLARLVRMWPTPTAHNSKEQNSPSESLRNTPTLASIAGGKLNPMWVEWLMGWPIGWTDLQPLGMDKFQEWQQQHSVFYPGE